MKISIKTFLFAICLSFTSNAILFAKQNSNNLDGVNYSEVDLTELDLEDLLKIEIVTIATGAEQTTVRAAAVTSVITAEDIKAMGATDLDEVLRTVPGLHVSRDTFYNPLYVIRGIYSGINTETLITINGTSISNLFLGGKPYAWGGMPVNSIARIEVIRGPGSAVHGADAFAGIINIITKNKADIEQPEIGVRLGKFSTHDAWVLHSDNFKGLDIALSVEYHDTQGHGSIIEEDAQTFYDKLFGTNASNAPGPVNLERRNLDVYLDMNKGNWRFRTGYQRRSDLGGGAGEAAALDPEVRFKDNRVTADLIYHNPELTKNIDFRAKLSYLDTAMNNVGNQRLYPRGAFMDAFPDGLIGNFSIFEHHAYIDTSAFYKGFEKHLVRIGAGYHYGDMHKVRSSGNFFDPRTGQELEMGGPVVDFSETPYNILPEKTRENNYAFIQDTWNIHKNWELTTGLRYDDYPDFDSTISPRLALVWAITPKLTSKLLYGQAFRAPPSFAELYQNTNSDRWAKGNPDLSLETIDTIEAALNYTVSEKLRLALNLFTYERNDVIRSALNEDGIEIMKNIGQIKGEGGEFEMRWQPLKYFNVLANYSYQQATDEETGYDLGRSPEHQGYLRTNWQFLPQWHLNTQVKWIGKRERSYNEKQFPNHRPALGGYTLVDLTLRHENLANNFGFALAFRNIFNEDARETSAANPDGSVSIPYDLPLAGRSYFAEIRYRF